MEFKVLIAEDERLGREELAYQLQNEKDFIICPSAENGIQFIEFYTKYEPDIVFIDIQMPKMTGIEAIKKVFQRNAEMNVRNPYVVFITAYDQYALEAFEFEAVDYLLKPYGPDRLGETIARLKKRLTRPNIIKRNSKLLIEDRDKVVVLKPSQILYACKNERLIDIHTIDGHIQTKMTLTELEELLHGYPFFRPHRSYLVNLEAIQEIVPWFNGAFNLNIKNSQTKIPVSRTAAKALFDRLREQAMPGAGP